ncbi:MAG: TetR family transcriptional regulator [Gammaproteobacteria bacterium]|nr:TetR family transcriptional regulator [Gammaproteobacteria bacterium]
MNQNRKKKGAFSRKSALHRRKELIEAGIACLGKGGMSAFTIDQICKQAGVSRGLINHHFKSKDDLLIFIYADMTDHLLYDYSCSDPHQLLASIIETSFDEKSFNRSNLRAWLAIWGQVASNEALNDLHRQRYGTYKARIRNALVDISSTKAGLFDVDSVARQLIALIDGLWLEYCLHSSGFSLGSTKTDCYRFLQAHGVILEIPAKPDLEI